MRLNLGYRDLPDTMLPKIQAIFGGATPAETQAAVQSYVWRNLRDIYRQFRLGTADDAARAAAAAQKAAIEAEDEADWPAEG